MIRTDTYSIPRKKGMGETHVMPDGTIMKGKTHRGSGQIFSSNNNRDAKFEELKRKYTEMKNELGTNGVIIYKNYVAEAKSEGIKLKDLIHNRILMMRDEGDMGLANFLARDKVTYLKFEKIQKDLVRVIRELRQAKSITNDTLIDMGIPADILKHNLLPYLAGGRQPIMNPYDMEGGEPSEDDEDEDIEDEDEETDQERFGEIIVNIHMEFGNFLSAEDGVGNTEQQRRFMNILNGDYDERIRREEGFTEREMDEYQDYELFVEDLVLTKFLEVGQELGYDEDDIDSAWNTRPPGFLSNFI